MKMEAWWCGGRSSRPWAPTMARPQVPGPYQGIPRRAATSALAQCARALALGHRFAQVARYRRSARSQVPRERVSCAAPLHQGRSTNRIDTVSITTIRPRHWPAQSRRRLPLSASRQPERIFRYQTIQFAISPVHPIQLNQACKSPQQRPATQHRGSKIDDLRS